MIDVIYCSRTQKPLTAHQNEANARKRLVLGFHGSLPTSSSLPSAAGARAVAFVDAFLGLGSVVSDSRGESAILRLLSSGEDTEEVFRLLRAAGA